MSLIKIVEIELDTNIYPRLQVGWLTAFQYAQAMRAGSVFPPILLGKLKHKLFLVDGWHRLQAMKMLHEEYIRATVKKYESKREMFLDAVKLNIVHGRPISQQEKTRIIDKLLQYGMQLEEISSVVHVPLDKMTVYTSRIITRPDGSKIYLKSIIARMETPPTDIDQDFFNVRSLPHLLSQLLEVLRSDFLLEDEVVKGLLIEIYGLLGEKLQLATTKS